MSPPPRDDEIEADPQPHESPSRSVSGITTLSIPEPAPLSPSGHHDDHLDGSLGVPEQQQCAIAGIFDDEEDDAPSGALRSVLRMAAGPSAGQQREFRDGDEEGEEEEDDEEDDEGERRRRRPPREVPEDEAEAAQRR